MPGRLSGDAPASRSDLVPARLLSDASTLFEARAEGGAEGIEARCVGEGQTAGDELHEGWQVSGVSRSESTPTT